MTNRAVDTRRVYDFELQLPTKDTPMSALRRLARRVWRECGGNRRFPSITAGRGTYYSGQYWSYCEGFARIVLARQHRNRVILLHELTHALGPSTHGKRFQNLYADLLMRYAL